jgi:5'(3')-deoxyribonucleotidase
VVILLDVDGVLADFTGALLRVANYITGGHRKASDVSTWDLFSPYSDSVRIELVHEIDKPNFCYALSPLPGAHQGVRGLRKLGHVLAVTAPWKTSDTWCYERTKWLEHYFGFAANDVLHVTDKFRVRGDVLIDDRESNIAAWSRLTDGLGILWDAPHNQLMVESARVSRAHTWDQVLSRVSRCVQNGKKSS